MSWGDQVCFVLRRVALRPYCAQGSLRATFEAGWSTASSRVFSRKLSCSPGPLAHPEEQGTFNPKVPGSRPGRPTTNLYWFG